MRKLLVLIMLLYSISVLPYTAKAQETNYYVHCNIAATEAADHIKQNLTVCGKVDDVKIFKKNNKTHLFLNIGGRYPHQVFSVVLWDKVARSLKGNPVDLFLNKMIAVKGEIVTYRNKPEIIVKDLSQITIKEKTTNNKRNKKSTTLPTHH